MKCGMGVYEVIGTKRLGLTPCGKPRVCRSLQRENGLFEKYERM